MRMRRVVAGVGSVVSWSALVVGVGFGGSGCGGKPPAAPVAEVKAPPPTPVAPVEPVIDLSPVPDPEGLVVVARIGNPDAVARAVGAWTHLPLPGGRELLRSAVGSDIADVVDLAQPVDAAVRILPGDIGRSTRGGSRKKTKVFAAFSIAAGSLESAKTKLGASHRLIPGPDGQFKVEGALRKSKSRSFSDEEEGSAGGDEDGCVLAPAAAPSGTDASKPAARLVCGEGASIEALLPYLTRTLARQAASSDLHVELRSQPVREPINELRRGLPDFAGGLFGRGSSSGIAALADAAVAEAVDLVNDADKVVIDARVAETGVVATSRVAFQSKTSLFARLATPQAKTEPPPSAFWHLPADTDLGLFSRGSDPGLFDHPRELVVNAIADGATLAALPEADARAVRDLTERTLPLLTRGAAIYAKGYDSAALQKAVDARLNAKPDDPAAKAEGARGLFEEFVGWHLYQSSEPIAKTGPLLKDWSTFWNRAGVAKWMKDKAFDAKTVPKVRVAPLPAGVTLPKDSVHLELTVPREEVVYVPEPPAVVRPQAGGPKPSLPVAKPPAQKRKTIALKPYVFHVFAVPDAGTTWFAFGMNEKLVAKKVAASLTAAPQTETLAKVESLKALRDGKMHAGGFVSLRAGLGVTALDRRSRSPFAAMATLPNKGATPIVMTFAPEGDKTAVSTFEIPRGVIEDGLRLVLAQ